MNTTSSPRIAAWRLGLVLVLALAGYVPVSPASAASSNLEKTKELVTVLESKAPIFEKARACQQLGEIGTKEAIPALAKLLSDEHLGAYARSGLEGIPDPSAAAALRASLGALKGNLRVGVINSLGVLRDPQAVDALRALVDDPVSGAANSALLALGRIGTDESIRILRHALAAGLDPIRSDAAAGCLLAAETQFNQGHAKTALRLYDAVRTAIVPSVYRAAATRGAIIARRSGGVKFLMGQLRSSDPVVSKAALLAIRDIPSPTLAAALNAEIGRSGRELQIQLLNALAECHNAQSFQVLEAKAAADDPAIRKAALRVLTGIAGPAQAGVLLKLVVESRNSDEAAIAASSLEAIAGAEVNDLIMRALASARDPGARVQLIRLLEARGATNAVGQLLNQAAGPDEPVMVAAFSALNTLAAATDIPALISLAKTCKTGGARDAAEKAICGVAANSGSVDRAGEAVLAELKLSAVPEEKNAWVRILICLGYAQALPTLESAMENSDESTAINAIENLSRWPDPAPMEALLKVIETSPNPRARRRALASVIQLATVAADEHQGKDPLLVAWIRRASPAVNSAAERRQILSILARIKSVESLRLMLPCLDQPDLQAEAATSIVQIAPALVNSDGSLALKAALTTIAGTAKNPDLRAQAAKLLSSIHPNDTASLFDGQSLAGWEGDSKVWRVRDGVIVGGSLDGNPRNEFLATTAVYTNFIIRLEYKLVGTEGFINSGVQFRSVRLQQPANEMCGFQADIGAGHSGCLYDESRRNKFLARAPDEQIKRLEKPGEWNQYQVRCEGLRIQITLNGEQTIDYVESDAALPRDGLIGLQIHGGCKAEVSFRHLTIQLLPD